MNRRAGDHSPAVPELYRRRIRDKKDGCIKVVVKPDAALQA
jgi:hypothetical protein